MAAKRIKKQRGLKRRLRNSYPRIKQYDVRDVKVLIDGVEITGFSPETAIAPRERDES